MLNNIKEIIIKFIKDGHLKGLNVSHVKGKKQQLYDFYIKTSKNSDEPYLAFCINADTPLKDGKYLCLQLHTDKKEIEFGIHTKQNKIEENEPLFKIPDNFEDLDIEGIMTRFNKLSRKMR